MSKKFFLISQVFYPDQVSTAGLFTNLCEELAKNGINPIVWCAQPSYDSRQRQKPRVLYNGIDIHYLPSTNYSKNSKIGRILNYITFSISLIVKLLFSGRKHKVFTSTNPPFLGILIAFICMLKNQKFVYIVQDVFPDGLVRLEKLKEKSLVVRIWKRLNRFTLKKANSIVIIGRDMQEWIKGLYPEALTKTKYIPIWQDENLISPIKYSENDFVVKHNLENCFVIQYSGNMGLWNDMKTYGHVVNEFDNEDINFVFIGDGVRKNDLTETIAPAKVNHVHFFPFQPKDQLKQSITACHVALVSLNEGLEGMAVPSKIMGILAAGIPVVASVPKTSEIAKIIAENDCGIVVTPGNVEECVEGIKKLHSDSDLRKNYGANARKAFLDKYASKVVANEYLKLI